MWTYESGSAYSASVPKAEAEFYSSIDDDDEDTHNEGVTDAKANAYPTMKVHDASSMNRDAVTDAMDTASLIFICISEDYVSCPLCRLECMYAKDLMRKGNARVVFIFLEKSFNAVNFKTKQDRNIAWKDQVLR